MATNWFDDTYEDEALTPQAALPAVTAPAVRRQPRNPLSLADLYDQSSAEEAAQDDLEAAPWTAAPPPAPAGLAQAPAMGLDSLTPKPFAQTPPRVVSWEQARKDAEAYEASKPKPEQPIFGLGDFASAAGGFISALPTTGTEAFYRMKERSKRPDQFSPEAQAAFAESRALQERMAQEQAEREKAGTSTTIGQAIREATSSSGYTLGSMLPAIAGGVATGAAAGALAGPVGKVVGGIVGGFAGSGAAAFTMSQNQFMEDAFREAEARMQKTQKRSLSEQEKQALYQEMEPLARDNALWEAGPEAVGNAFMLVGGGIAAGLLGKQGISKLAGGALRKGMIRTGALATGVGMEFATETATELGQALPRARMEAYLEGRPMEDAVSRYAGKPLGGAGEAFEEIWRPTLGTVLMFGLGGTAVKGASKANERFRQNPQEAEAIVEMANKPDVLAAMPQQSLENLQELSGFLRDQWFAGSNRQENMSEAIAKISAELQQRTTEDATTQRIRRETLGDLWTRMAPQEQSKVLEFFGATQPGVTGWMTKEGAPTGQIDARGLNRLANILGVDGKKFRTRVEQDLRQREFDAPASERARQDVYDDFGEPVGEPSDRAAPGLSQVPPAPAARPTETTEDIKPDTVDVAGQPTVTVTSGMKEGLAQLRQQAAEAEQRNIQDREALGRQMLDDALARQRAAQEPPAPPAAPITPTPGETVQLQRGQELILTPPAPGAPIPRSTATPEDQAAIRERFGERDRKPKTPPTPTEVIPDAQEVQRQAQAETALNPPAPAAEVAGEVAPVATPEPVQPSETPDASNIRQDQELISQGREGGQPGIQPSPVESGGDIRQPGQDQEGAQPAGEVAQGEVAPSPYQEELNVIRKSKEYRDKKKKSPEKAEAWANEIAIANSNARIALKQEISESRREEREQLARQEGIDALLKPLADNRKEYNFARSLVTGAMDDLSKDVNNKSISADRAQELINEAERLGAIAPPRKIAALERIGRAEEVAPTPAATQKVKTPDEQMEVDVGLEVVELADLITSDDARFPKSLQPRGRGERQASATQVFDIAKGLNPDRLLSSPVTSDGAPIVGPDNLVESGNGRVMAIRTAYGQFQDRADAYRAKLQEQGFDTTGMTAPVLIRRRVSPLDDAQRVEFTQKSNMATVASMSPSERATLHAQRLLSKPAVLDAYRGGDPGLSVNAEFVGRFFQEVLDPSERGQFQTKEGMLNAEGKKEIQSAILAVAYPDVALLDTLLESQDNNIKTIGGALREVAPDILKTKAYLRQHPELQSLDLSGPLTEAARLVNQAWAENKGLKDILDQQGMFGDIDPTVERLTRLFFSDADLRKGLSQPKLVRILQSYAENARRIQPSDPLFDDIPQITVGDLLSTMEKRREDELPAEQADLLGGGAARPSRPASGAGDQRPGADRPSAADGAPGPREGQEDGGKPAKQKVAPAPKAEAASQPELPETVPAIRKYLKELGATNIQAIKYSQGSMKGEYRVSATPKGAEIGKDGYGKTAQAALKDWIEKSKQEAKPKKKKSNTKPVAKLEPEAVVEQKPEESPQPEAEVNPEPAPQEQPEFAAPPPNGKKDAKQFKDLPVGARFAHVITKNGWVEYEKTGETQETVVAVHGIVKPSKDGTTVKVGDVFDEVGEKAQSFVVAIPDSVPPAQPDADQRRYSRAPAADSSLEAVRARYAGTPQWMKAPNGQPTKLNERQWLQVRTPAFKAWFGDWESNPANASKVVDENGEPMVVYHGTKERFIEKYKNFLKLDQQLESTKKEAIDIYGYLSDDNSYENKAYSNYFFEDYHKLKKNISDAVKITASPYAMGLNEEQARQQAIKDIESRYKDNPSLMERALKGSFLEARHQSIMKEVDNIAKKINENKIAKSIHDKKLSESEVFSFIEKMDGLIKQSKDIKYNLSRISGAISSNEAFGTQPNERDQANDPGYLGSAAYFTPDKEEADWYARRGKGYVYHVFLSIKTPLYIDKPPIGFWEKVNTVSSNLVAQGSDPFQEKAEATTKVAKEYGFDGVYKEADGNRHPAAEWAAYDPAQIKSATENVGTFSPTDADIRYSSAADTLTEVGLTQAQARAEAVEALGETNVRHLERNGFAVWLEPKPGARALPGNNRTYLSSTGQEVVAPADAQAFVDKGVIHLIPSNMRTGALNALLHESAHLMKDERYAEGDRTILRMSHAVLNLAGLRNFIGNPGFQDLAEQVQRMAREGNPVALKALAQAQQVDPNRIAEESVAYLVEYGDMRLPIVRRILAAIRAALYRMGVKMELRPEDVRQLAISALKARAQRNKIEQRKLVRLAELERLYEEKYGDLALGELRVEVLRNIKEDTTLEQFRDLVTQMLERRYSAPPSAIEALRLLRDSRFVSDRTALDTLGEFPEYLYEVGKFIAEQRQKLVEGRLTPREVAKAYLITQSSIGSPARSLKALEPAFIKAGLSVSEVPALFLNERGGLRPEELMAWWLGTANGQRALNALEQGQIDRAAFEEFLTLREPYGRDPLIGNSVLGLKKADGFQWGTAPEKRGDFNLANLLAFTGAINATQGDPKALVDVLGRAKGISTGKTGFIGHLLGLGNRPTVDAVEINFWLTGKADTRTADIAQKAKETVQAIREKLADRRVREAVFQRINQRLMPLANRLADQYQLPRGVMPHLLHHWLWDKAKGLETTHAGLYEAMRRYSVAPAIEVGEATMEEFEAVRARFQARQAETPFRQWFGKGTPGVTATVDGTPITLYHGTNNPLFTEWDSSRAAEASGHPTSGLGFFMTADKGAAARYGNNLLELHAKIDKPYYLTDADLTGIETRQDAERLRWNLMKQGYDGAVVEAPGAPHANYVIAFKPNQIKFTTNEKPTASPDMRYSLPPAPGQPPTPADAQRFLTDIGALNLEPQLNLIKRIWRNPSLWRKELMQSFADAAGNTRPAWTRLLSRQQIVEMLQESPIAQLAKHFEDTARLLDADKAEGKHLAFDIAKRLREAAAKSRDKGRGLYKLWFFTTLESVDPTQPAPQRENYGDTADYLRARQAHARAVEMLNELRRANPVLADLYKEVIVENKRSFEAYHQALKDRLGRGANGIFNAMMDRAKDMDPTATPTTLTQRLAKLAKDSAAYDAFTATVRQRLQQPDMKDAAAAALRDTLPDDAQKALFDDIVADVRGKVKSSVDALQSVYEQARVKEPYFPLSRWGDYQVYAEKAGEPKPVFAAFEREQDQRAAIAQLQKEGWTVKVNYDATGKLTFKPPADSFLGKMFVMVDEILSPGKDATQQEKSVLKKQRDALKDEFYQMYLRSLPDLSSRKHFLHRKGIPGFSMDALRGFAQLANSRANAIARLKHSDILSDSLMDMERALKRAGLDPSRVSEINRAGALLGELQLSYEWMMNPTNATWANRLTSFGFLWHLTNPSTALVNLTQVPIATFPDLAAKFGGGSAFSALSKAIKDYGEWKFHGKVAKEQAMQRLYAEFEGDLGKALKSPKISSQISRTEAVALAGMSDDAPEFSGGVKGSAAALYRGALYYGGWLYQKAEVANREITVIAAYRLARRKADAEGKSREQAHDYATEVAYNSMTRTQGDFSLANRAWFMRGNAMRVMFLFRSFSHMMTFNLLRDAYQSVKGKDAESKKLARARLAWTGAASLVFAGATGFPMYTLIAAIANGIWGSDPDDPWDFDAAVRDELTAYGGDTLMRTVMQGPLGQAPRALNLLGLDVKGVDIAPRVSLDLIRLWVRRQPEDSEGGAAMDWWMGQVAGPLYGTARGVAEGLRMLGQTSHDPQAWWRTLEGLTPAPIRNLAKAARFEEHGVTTRRGDLLMDEFGFTDLITQAIGFTPDELADQYRTNTRLWDLKYSLEKRRRNIYSLYIFSVEQGDEAMQKTAMERVERFNQLNPEYPITFDGLRGAYKKFMRARALQEGGVYIPSKGLKARVFRDLTADES